MPPSSSSNKRGPDSGQFGEVDMIEAELSRIGIRNRWCFEVGAADGVLHSNTKRFREAGWNAVLIEADDALFVKLQLFAASGVYLFHEKIDPQSLDRILAESGAPADLDVGVIDIDGQDYWVWAGLENFKPRLMLVEFAPYREADYLPEINTFGAGGYNQAGKTRIAEMGEVKGYEPIGSTYCNILFRRKDVKAT